LVGETAGCGRSPMPASTSSSSTVVRHHAADPAGIFRSSLAKLKPGGHIIGLWLGRLPTL